MRGVLLPLSAVLISTVWTLGIMNLFHISFSIITNIIPVVLLATGSAYGIHVVSAFGESPPPGEGRRERASRSLSMVALPVLLAGLTTMAGFLAFVFGSYLTMIREFGIFSSLGVLLALVVSLTFVPRCCPTCRRRPRSGAAGGRQRRARAGMVGSAAGASWCAAPGWILAVGGALAAAAIAVMPLVRREVDVLSYFSRRTEIRQAERMMKADFGGSTTVQVLVTGDVQDPRVLAEMKRMEDFLKARPQLANVHSAVELLEEMSFALVDRRELPATREQAASLFFLLEGEPVLDQLVRPDRQEALIQGTLANLDSPPAHSLIKDTEGLPRLPRGGARRLPPERDGDDLLPAGLGDRLQPAVEPAGGRGLHVPVQPAAGALRGRSPASGWCPSPSPCSSCSGSWARPASPWT